MVDCCLSPLSIHDHFLPSTLVAEALQAISSCAAGGDPSSTVAALTSDLVQLETVDMSASERYHQKLKRALEEKGQVSVYYHTTLMKRVTLYGGYQVSMGS